MCIQILWNFKRGFRLLNSMWNLHFLSYGEWEEQHTRMCVPISVSVRPTGGLRCLLSTAASRWLELPSWALSWLADVVWTVGLRLLLEQAQQRVPSARHHKKWQYDVQLESELKGKTWEISKKVIMQKSGWSPFILIWEFRGKDLNHMKLFQSVIE